LNVEHVPPRFAVQSPSDAHPLQTQDDEALPGAKGPRARQDS
jgi:hypothetical protein